MEKNKYAAKREFYKSIQDLAEHPVVLEMKKYPQHGKTNCYKHCLRVAYCNYCLCKMFHLDARSAARAGMIHDLFLYDWHTHAAQTGERFHGLKHPEKAYRNAYELRFKRIWTRTAGIETGRRVRAVPGTDSVFRKC